MSEWIISAEDIDDITGGGFTVVQKLVRCEDCVHFEPNIFYSLEGIPFITANKICTKFGNIYKTKTDGFCNFGERRSE